MFVNLEPLTLNEIVKSTKIMAEIAVESMEDAGGYNMRLPYSGHSKEIFYIGRINQVYLLSKFQDKDDLIPEPVLTGTRQEAIDYIAMNLILIA